MTKENEMPDEIVICPSGDETWQEYDGATPELKYIRADLVNQNGWRDIDVTKPEKYNEVGIFALEQKGGKWHYEKAYCAYDLDGWPLIDPEHGDCMDAYGFTDYTHYLPLTPPNANDLSNAVEDVEPLSE